AEVAQPVVVGARDGGREVGLEAVDAHDLRHVEAEHEEPAAREEDGHVEALAVHGLELGGGIPPAPLRLGECLVLHRAPGPGRVAVCRKARATRRRRAGSSAESVPVTATQPVMRRPGMGSKSVAPCCFASAMPTSSSRSTTRSSCRPANMFPFTKAAG